MKRNYSILIVLFILLINGCTTNRNIYKDDSSITIEDGEDYKLTINTIPSDAKIYLQKESEEPKYIGNSRVTIQNYREPSCKLKVIILKDFYESKEILIEKRSDVNLFFENIVMIPSGIMTVKLNITEEGRIAKEEHERLLKAQEEENERIRQMQRDEKEKKINTAINNRTVVILDDIYFDNPYAYQKDVAYHIAGLYPDVFIHQWLEKGFIAGCLPKEVAYEFPRDIRFYVKDIPNIQAIRDRIKNVYMVYTGTETFVTSFGGKITLPSFIILYYEQ